MLRPSHRAFSALLRSILAGSGPMVTKKLGLNRQISAQKRLETRHVRLSAKSCVLLAR
jgi:hypothetical protein